MYEVVAFTLYILIYVHPTYYVEYARKHCNDKGMNLDILTDLHVVSTIQFEQASFGMPPVGLCAYMY